ncbi:MULTISPECIES: hypothetical protein [Amycolatopsis]|uniref:Intracellular septation protein A n=2 Tax=Amycolatopsis TaxID=1813 RepID=A0A1I3VZP9_9PSEU|nr:hypothetical protein [Amycolatopsis sacchari]SFK00630.1 hypothetical protein SAMN05421835_11215 [Amycolatopsis sacchari]
MHFLRSFAPWLAYAVLAKEVDWRYSALAGLLVSAVLVVWQRRRRTPWDALVIELSGALFFTLLTVFAFAAPDSPLRHEIVALPSIWLALTAWGSLAVGKPFTLGIARTMIGPEMWDNPLFRRTNAVITAVWASGFTFHAVALSLVHGTVGVIVVEVIGFAVPAVFTIRYPAIVRARALKELS